MLWKRLLLASSILLSTTLCHAYEDFTTWDETDPDGRLVVTTNKVTWNNTQTRNYDQAVSGDYGADYFGDYEVQFTMYVDAIVSAALPTYWLVATTQEVDWNGFGGTGQYINDYSDAGGDPDFVYGQRGGTSDPYSANEDTLYYFTVSRSGTSGTCKIYSDSARTTLLDTLSNTVVDTALRYMYGYISYNSGNSGRNVTGYIENLEFIEAVSGTGTVIHGNTTIYGDVEIY